MQAIILLTLALCSVALAQTRPVISEDFFAQVNTELHVQDNVLFGQGNWAIDTTTNQGVENTQFNDQQNHAQFFVLNLQRYDLGEVYQIASYNHNQCNATKVTGNLPCTWCWLAYANYTGTINFHGLTLDAWTLIVSGATLTVGVDPHNSTIPVTYDYQTSSQEVFYEFQHFFPTTEFNHNVFDVPPQCSGSEEATATPTRPNIAEDFLAATQVEIQNTQGHFFGQGRLASYQTNNQFVEQYQYQDQYQRPVEVLNLLRYDIGKTYSINSWNHTCDIQSVSGDLPAFWNWVALATFVGQHQVTDGPLIDIWNYVAGNVNLTLGVADNNVNVPVFLGRGYPTGFENIQFHFFNATIPSENDFTVPPECQ